MDHADWSFLCALRGEAAVFCADGGVENAVRAGFIPDYYIGDGDSGGIPPAGVPAVLLPVRKDLTDLQAAWEQARSMGFRKIVFTGCTGGRLDHHLAAVQLLETVARAGCEGVIADPDNEIAFLLPGQRTARPGAFRFFSLLPVNETSTVSIRGAQYDLDRGLLRRGDSLGVSNGFRDGPVLITVHDGPCYLFLSGRIS